MAVLTLIVLECFLNYIFAFELSHAYTADSPLYWAVGRGMLNGLCPYSEMYENKPVGVFAISALSFLITNDTILCNWMSILSVIVIMLMPGLTAAEHYRLCGGKDKPYELHVIIPSLTAVLIGIILAAYCEDRSGAFQVEAMGTAFSMLFIWFSRGIKLAKTKKSRIVCTALAALFISCAVMMKEPFLIAAVAGTLIFLDKLEDFLECVIIPCVIGGAATVVLLAASGVLVPYLTIYVKHMFGTRLSGETSAFTRARDISALSWDMAYFDWGLFLVVLLFLGLTLAAYLKQKNLSVLFHVLKIGVMIYAASFCVGMGGQYYNHHYIFAAPIIGSFMMYGTVEFYKLMKEKKLPDSAVILCFGIILIIAYSNAGRMYGGDFRDRFASISAKAEYVDNLLDYYDVERYQYIGFNGEDAFYGLTKHSPQGPVFVQDGDNFNSPDTWFSQQLVKQINESDIVIVRELNLPEMNDTIQQLLDSDFSTEAPGSFDEQPPEDLECTIYYRNK